VGWALSLVLAGGAVSVDAIELVGKSLRVVVLVIEGEISDVLLGAVRKVVNVNIWRVVGDVDVWRVVGPLEGVVIVLPDTGSSREIDVVDGLSIVVEVINTTEVSTGKGDGATASWRDSRTDAKGVGDSRYLSCSAAYDTSVSIVAREAIAMMTGMYMLWGTFAFIVL
jgi:hypothetical protein